MATIQTIQSQEFIGDSLVKINNNDTNLNTDILNLSSISLRGNNIRTIASVTLPTTTTRVLSVYNGSTYVGYVPVFT